MRLFGGAAKSTTAAGFAYSEAAAGGLNELAVGSEFGDFRVAQSGIEKNPLCVLVSPIRCVLMKRSDPAVQAGFEVARVSGSYRVRLERSRCIADTQIRKSGDQLDHYGIGDARRQCVAQQILIDRE